MGLGPAADTRIMYAIRLKIVVMRNILNALIPESRRMEGNALQLWARSGKVLAVRGVA